MTMLGHMFPGWHCRSSLTWDMSLGHIHHILWISPFFQAFRDFLTQKKFHSKGYVKTAFYAFLVSKPLNFDLSDINNIVMAEMQGCLGIIF